MIIKLTKIQELNSKLTDVYPLNTVIIGEFDGVIEIDRQISVRNWNNPSLFGLINIGIVKEITSPNSFLTRGARWKWEKLSPAPEIIKEKEEIPPVLFESGLIIKDEEE